jgi:hypothetical protein
MSHSVCEHRNDLVKLAMRHSRPDCPKMRPVRCVSFFPMSPFCFSELNLEQRRSQFDHLPQFLSYLILDFFIIDIGRSERESSWPAHESPENVTQSCHNRWSTILQRPLHQRRLLADVRLKTSLLCRRRHNFVDKRAHRINYPSSKLASSAIFSCPSSNHHNKKERSYQPYTLRQSSLGSFRLSRSHQD